MSEIVPHENPLVPNKKLRQMFVAMTEARCLDEHIAMLQRKGKIRLQLDSIRGQEACRVSIVIDLKSDDMVIDSQVGVTTELILGADAGSLLKNLAARGSIGKAQGSGSEKQLPWIEDVEDRLRIAMGAALAFKTLKRTNLVVAYVRPREAAGSVKRVLTLAAKLDLPMIFVVLPERDSKSKNISRKTRALGVPGIPVDASDAVALYRVAQESIGRTRGGDGPVVIECIRYRLKGKQSVRVLDPIAQMEEFMLARKVEDRAWMDQVSKAFRKRLTTQKL